MNICKDCTQYEIDTITSVPFCGLDGDDIEPDQEACWRFPGIPPIIGKYVGEK